MSRATAAQSPLDLRLLPAAGLCWAVALAAVHLPAGTGMGLGLTLLLCGALLVVVLWLLLPLHRQDESAGRAGRPRRIALQLALCCATSGAVALSAGGTLSDYETSGWTQAVEAEVPFEAVWRLTGDARQLQSPGFDGSPRMAATAVVEEAELPSAQAPSSVGAEVVVLLNVAEGVDEAPMRAGHRYRATVRASATGLGDRATALLHPFDEDQPVELPPDGRTTVADSFNDLRDATRELSRGAVGDAPALLPGLSLGDRSEQSAELTGAMVDSGLSHLTVVSGTHCALVLGAVLGTARLSRMPRWVTVPLVVTTLVLYVMLVHPLPSVIRAAVMGAIGAMAVFSGRGRASSALLCVCVLLLLLYDPWYAVEPAFQLSVASTLGIVLVGQRLRQLLEPVLPSVIAAPLALTASAQIFTVPVLLPLAEGVNTYSVPANILAAPLLPFATVPATAAAVISTTWPSVSGGLLWLAGLPSAGIGAIGRTASGLPQALAPWPGGWLGTALVTLYLIAALAAVHRLTGAGAERRDRAARTRATRGLETARSLVISVAAGALSAVMLPLPAPWSSGQEHWRVAICDVGQGDMLVVRTGDASGIVVDAGEDPQAADACLTGLGVDAVEVLMITHEHLDHYGGASGVVQGRELGYVLYSASRGWEPAEELDVRELGEGQGVDIVRGEPGQSAAFAGEYPVDFQVWAADDHHAEPNDNSLVVSFELTDDSADPGSLGSAEDPVRLLTTGDLEEQAAAALLRRGELPLHVDLLKVAHHGAANGGIELIETRTPAVALIGVGEENRFGHPADEIRRALDDAGAVTYRTDQHGTVVLSFEQGQFTADPLDHR